MGSASTAVFDHPTPLDGQSTLPRLLDSLCDQLNAPEFTVIIIAASVSASEQTAVSKRLNSLLKPYREKLNLVLFDHVAFEDLLEHFTQQGFDELQELIGFQGYGKIKNLQLIVPVMFGTEIVIALDDDEVVSPDYIQKALFWIGKNIQGTKISGIGGPYLDEEGSPYIQEPESTKNILVDKSILMNQMIRKLLSFEVPSKTPMIFGGNMVFHRDLFTRVPFDPAITRGEDIDYLINARIEGIDFFFDPNLTITHLPPRHYEAPEYGKRKQDTIRFFYELEKIRLASLPAADLASYPGNLLNSGLENLAKQMLEGIQTKEMTSQFGTPDQIIQYAYDYAKVNAVRYFEYQKQWQTILKFIFGQK